MPGKIDPIVAVIPVVIETLGISEENGQVFVLYGGGIFCVGFKNAVTINCSSSGFSVCLACDERGFAFTGSVPAFQKVVPALAKVFGDPFIQEGYPPFWTIPLDLWYLELCFALTGDF